MPLIDNYRYLHSRVSVFSICYPVDVDVDVDKTPASKKFVRVPDLEVPQLDIISKLPYRHANIQYDSISHPPTDRPTKENYSHPQKSLQSTAL